ncbi:hypothetical protein PSN45_000165 [Yamadazyma tenuis]|uniref:Uncharacterized protein n=1 Tax=Candida tenuis (strain ATCC 10573 / BCRC 21748 / CBS 615 / JCM 9827 / NBRC 10315 / NRRL Y-1498 / VKM Y-70) TaxID=590646 RepID=G3BB01_CANTC|nr:uncharacterized protein CANTEDRAFT_108940 [Yamadazyma tenuis ATCC 10573]EGV61492.1 hypothetical protein CANTEDRAFT_108940 [Yamadazyma tenuis ATCC 10573]WEJ92710.1 hypothetical protein PSN45_000165 [Yamadazyma tenuis]
MAAPIQIWAKQVRAKVWDFTSMAADDSAVRLNKLLSRVLQVPVSFPDIDGGYHLLYNNQPNLQLGADGYDNYQAPVHVDTGDSIFSRRMWVKGSMMFYRPVAPNQFLHSQEVVSHTRHIGDQMFVTIERRFSHKHQSPEPAVVESRTLMYTNSRFKPHTPSSSRIMPEYSHHLQISSTDIMQYSCLTSNLHKIHYDKNYCQIEGLRDVIVQGPFMVTLAVAWFRTVFPHLRPVQISYKNAGPVYAHERCELLLKRASTNANMFVVEIVGAGKDVRLAGELVCDSEV